MGRSSQYHRANLLIRLLAVALAGSGVLILFEVMRPPWRPIHYVFTFVFELLTASIGAWCVFAAWLGWRHRTSTAVRWFCLTLAIEASVIGVWFLEKLRWAKTDKPDAASMLAFLTLATVIMFFAVCLARRFTARLEVADHRSYATRRLIHSICIGIISFQFWGILSDLLWEVVPKTEGLRDVPKGLWGFGAIAGAAIIAKIFYDIATRLLDPERKIKSHGPGHSVQ